jgi:glycosyltransferase involved in cell wall biosynthesis
MRILHVTQGYTPAIGGTEWLIQCLSEELVRQFRDDVTVFTTDRFGGEAFFNPQLPKMATGWEEIHGVHVRRFPVRSRISQVARLAQSPAYHLNLPGNEWLRAMAGGPIIPGLERAIREYPADVISASSFPLLHMFAALRSARKTQRPCVLLGGLHPQDDWGFQRSMIYRTIQQATCYVAYTDFEAAYVIQRGASPDRVFTVGLGVDPEPFQKTSTADAKRSLGLEGKPVVAFIGQLGGHKGVDTLVRAMPRVWRAVPDAHLLLAGARTMFAEQIESTIREWPLADQKKVTVHYNFSDEEKPVLFSAADVFAYPSGFESFGLAFLEAWAAGKPVIGCRRGAVPSVVKAGRDGLLVDYQSVDMLAEAIILLLRNPSWARSLGEAGRAKVLSDYTWLKIARRFRDVYDFALGK